MVNIGSLYYIISKGIQQGVQWQMKYLLACLLQLILDIVILESIEVMWIDFGLPGLTYHQVVVDGVQQTLRLFHEFLKHVATISSGVPLVHSIGKKDLLEIYSMILAIKKDVLIESQMVLFRESSTNMQILNSTKVQNQKDTKVMWYSKSYFY